MGVWGLFACQLSAQGLPNKANIVSAMRLVNEYWITQNPTPGNNQWARAAYFTGNMDFYNIYPKTTYLDYANLWASNNNWALNGGTSTRNADNQTCGQTYIDLYLLDEVKVPSKINAIKTSIDNMVMSTKIDDWWWIDALYMAMPVMARLAYIQENDVYLTKMYQMYYHTKVTRGLYNAEEGLWYRDESFKPPYFTPKGEDSYWSRGNGWVFGAHVRVLQLLPVTDPHRAEYIDTFKKMAAALKLRQRADGFWNVSLDDPNDFGGPETSGTAFFTYGMAWGIGNGFLDRDTYLPVVEKAWQGLTSTAVQPSGFLSYVQGVGTNPASSQPVTVNSTADFGVGAFLLAGSEVLKLAAGEMPVPSNFGLASVAVPRPGSVSVVFSHDVDLATALDAANYAIDNGVTVAGAAMGSDGRTVVLSVSNLGFGRYKLTVGGIKNLNGTLVEFGESKSFAYSGVSAITASGFEAGTGNTPDKTMDFDLSTRWSADGQGQWITFDLGEPRLVTSVDVAFYKGNERRAFFSIHLSANGTDFAQVFNGESSGTTVNFENYDFPDQQARYVKIIGYGNSASTWNSITETRINWAVPTGIREKGTPAPPIGLVPNPYHGSKLLVLTGNSPATHVSVAISDMSGRVLKRYSLMPVNETLELDGLHLPNGVYVVTVSAERETKSEVLVVK